MADDDDIIQVMRRWKLELQRQEAAQMRAMARRWAQIEQTLDGQISALILDLAERRRLGETITQATVWRLERYQQLLVQIQEELDAYRDYAVVEVEGGQRAYGQVALEHSTSILRQLAGVEVAFNRLPVEAVELMVGNLEDGSPLRTLLLSASRRADSIDRLSRALINGTAQGINPRKVARQMKDELSRGLDHALTVARSEEMRVYRQMTDNQYRASGIVEGKYRLTARDSRVCMACLARDGEFIPLGQPMDEHPNGRCTTVAAIAGRPKPQWLNARDWFGTLDEETQVQMMGAGRYEAWRRGDFELSELAVTVRGGRFGPNLQTAPLRDLTQQ